MPQIVNIQFGSGFAGLGYLAPLDDKRMKPYQYMNKPLPQDLVPAPA